MGKTNKWIPKFIGSVMIVYVISRRMRIALFWQVTFIFTISHFSTKFRQMSIRQMVAFKVMSDSTESRIRRRGFRQIVMDASGGHQCPPS